MNKKKWKAKFAGRDSRRFLKHNAPFYGDKYHFGAMPPARQWQPKARDILHRVLIWQEWKELCEIPYRGSAEWAALARMSKWEWAEREAVSAAFREEGAKKNGEKRVALAHLMYREGKTMREARKMLDVYYDTACTWDFELCRAVAWHVGIHYNHTGRNRFGHTRKDNGLNR